MTVRRAALAASCLVVLTGCTAPDVDGRGSAAPTVVAPKSAPTSAPLRASSVRWHDEFSGPAGARPSDEWGFDTGATGWGNNELEDYTNSRNNSRLDGDGHLQIIARRDGTGYTSARMTTEDRMSFGYGTLSARIKVPSGTGLLPAFWLLGTDLPKVGYPASGEIDVIETLGKTSTGYFTIHGPTTAGQAYSIGSTETYDPPLADGFHVYTVIRHVDSIETQVDGVTTGRITRSQLAPDQRWVFNKKFYVLLDVAVGGNFPGPPNSSTPFPATMTVDWIRLTS